MEVCLPEPGWRALLGRDELLELGHALRSDGRRTTNLLIGNRRISDAAEAGLLCTRSDDPGGVILFEDRGARRVYFIQTSADAAVAALGDGSAAFGRDTVADVTGRDGQFAIFDDIFLRSGFRFYKCFRRMSRRPAEVGLIDESAVRALKAESDVSAVHAMIDAVFDPLAEFMPDVAELQALLHCGGILVAMGHAGALGGFLAYETIGATSLLRYVAVDPEERGKGIGGQLIARYLHDTQQALRHDLWVWERNEAAIKHYVANGFAFTGQCNMIYRFEE